MGTTALYVELVIIGLETMLWILSFSIYFTDIQYLSIICELLEKLPATALLLGLLYILGMIVDRAADKFFEKTEEKARAKSGLHAESSILIWKKSGQEEYFKFTRSKIRILRASVLNLPLLAVAIALDIFRYYGWRKPFFCFTVFVGAALSVLSLYGYKRTMKNYYAKARILEAEIERSERTRVSG